MKQLSEEPTYFCIVCDAQVTERLKAVTGVDYVTHHGTIFGSGGNYGSEVWDPCVNFLNLNVAVCNDCLMKKVDRAIVERTEVQPSKLTYRPLKSYLGLG